MCGICGVISFQRQDLLDKIVLRRMCQTLRHRGPDDEGYYLDQKAGLAMRRLSIIDLESGHQPISNEDETIWLVFNGEIYNYREKRAELERTGHAFKTQSDSEVIVHAYESYGSACVDHFNGMFAFAIWDSIKQRLFVARDRLGIKPLYYWATQDFFLFGSELKAILANPIVPSELDMVALDQYLTLEYIPAPRSIFQDIYKLLPGHWLTFDRSGLEIQEYWDISRPEPLKDEREYPELLRELIDDAVRLRLISDVPLGAFLSGGIDSSTIVASMSHLMAEPARTFSIGFEEATYNELPYARLAAKRFKTDHFEEILKPEIGNLAEKLVGFLDEPLGDFSIFPTYLVSQVARRTVKVVLSGDGGDEIFGGYDTYVAQYYEQYYRALPKMARQKLLPKILSMVPPQRAKKGMINKSKRFVEGAALPADLMHTRWMIFMSSDDKANLYSPALNSALDGLNANSVLRNRFKSGVNFDDLARQQYVDIKTYLVDNILTKVDRMSMAVSLETRVPLLDHRIVEFALGLPPELKIHRGRTKLILKRAMADRLPSEILNKPKEGFSIPIKNWLHGPLNPLMLDLLSSNSVKRRGYFQHQTIERWINEHMEGRVNHSHRLWMLMAFELWHQRYMDGVRAAV